MFKLTSYLFCITLFFFFNALANTPYIPKDLKQWEKWVEEKHPEINCIKTPDGASTVCIWNGVLNINANKKGLTFSQKLTALKDEISPLPGDKKFWPKDVKDNGKNAKVISQNNGPAIFLEKGTHNIKGTISWQNMPESFSIPKEVALINLKFDGKLIKQVNRDASGKIWFGNNEDEKVLKPQADQTDVRVFRKITDGEPITIESHLNISVSGKPREMLLGKYLPDNNAVISLYSPLPARIEKDGNLRIQVKPGTHTLTLKSRQLSHLDTISFTTQVGKWPGEEVWSFESNNNIRVVNVAGASRLDPSQTSMPNHWRNLQAFLVKLNEKLILKEEHRGDWAPTPDELILSREMWLDFNGKGYTVQDNISGTISQANRLTSENDFAPGTATLNSDPQLITEKESGEIGIEVKQGKINFNSIGRYKNTQKFSLSGWKHSFKNVSTKLNLPPGWKFFYASGVDRVKSSWVGAWNLWDLFFMLIIVVSIAKLMGNRWGLIAFLTLLFTFHENDAPIYSWIVITVISALLKVIPKENNFRKVINICNYIVLVFIAATIVTFSIFNIRKTIYPQLEFSGQRSYNNSAYSYGYADSKEMDKFDADEVLEQEAMPAAPMKRKMSIASNVSQSRNLSMLNVQRIYDVNAKIQTGPGVPSWNWNQYFINHTGPVEPGQTMKLYLLPPIATRVINILNCLLLITLLYGFIKQTIPEIAGKIALSSILKKSSTVSAIFILLFLFPQNSSAQFPSESILKDLETRLLKEPLCKNSCAEMAEGKLTAKDNNILIELIVNATVKTSFYLPGSTTGWRPSSVSLNGQSDPALYSYNQKIAIILSEGFNRITVKGDLLDNKIDIPFNFTAHNLTANTNGWTIQGLKDGTLPGNTISLEKVEQTNKSEETQKKLLPDPAPVFCKVIRQINFDKQWTIYTTVTRTAPERGAITLQIPLLKGEAILTSGVTVKNDSAIILIPDRVQSFSWQSNYKRTDKITLTAPNTSLWQEEWTVTSTTMWHVETLGLTQIKNSNYNNRPTWIPRPQDSLEIIVTKPKAIEGPTKTFESVKITHTPGKKSSESIMTLNIKSSRGDKTQINLPEGSELEKVLIDQTEKVISHQDGVLDIPLHPGEQIVNIHWKEKTGIKTFWNTPVPNLNSPVTNISLEMKVPNDRWPLFVIGPKLGPAMLIWGILIVLILIAIILSKSGYTILNSWQWILLFLGMSTVNNLGGIFIVIWFILLNWRDKFKGSIKDATFNWLQILMICLTIIAIISVAATVPFGLLSTPNMQITGNGSFRSILKWYQDSATTELPKGILISVPLWIYRVVMLLWSLWLATALPSWLKWAWKIYSKDGLWRKTDKTAIKNKKENNVKSEKVN